MTFKAWLLTDGKPGDENQCIGIAERAGIDWEIKHVTPRLFFSAFPLPVLDFRDRPSRKTSVILPPYPDIVIASGRRTLPYLKAIAGASAGRCFTVYLKDPRPIKHHLIGTRAADFVWAPDHDGLTGPNVLSTLMSPHRLSSEAIARARASPDPRIAALRTPRIAVLLGGPTKAHPFEHTDVERLVALLQQVLAGPEAFIPVASASRRTPTCPDGRHPDLVHALRRLSLGRRRRKPLPVDRRHGRSYHCDCGFGEYDRRGVGHRRAGPYIQASNDVAQTWAFHRCAHGARPRSIVGRAAATMAINTR